MTLAQKIFSRASGGGAVLPGQTVWLEPDLALLYDWPGITDKYAYLVKNKLGVERLPLRERSVVFIDHMVPAGGEKEAAFHQGTRRWCAEQGMRLIENAGIGHQAAADLRIAKPGQLLVHFDTHVQTLGALGCLPLSVMSDILTTLALGKIWFEVPHTIRVKLKGALRPGVDGRDLNHHLIRDQGPDWAIGSVLEFVGEGAREMSLDQRMNLLAQICFTGAASGVFPLDDTVRAFYNQAGVDDYEPVSSDEDADFKQVLEYDLSRVEPAVAAPPNPGNIQSIAQVGDVPLDQGYIGSCASGRMEDLAAAAAILKGRGIKEGFRLYVVPSSRQVMKQAADSGVLATLVEAGAFVSSPSCDYCYGKTQSLAAGERAISTGTLNVPGRMGSTEGEIYLASAATVAASAVKGRITDPREYLDDGRVVQK